MLKTGLDQLQADVALVGDGELDLERMHSHIAATRDDLVSLRSVAAPILSVAPQLDWLPGIGYDVAAAPALIDAAVDLLEAGQVTLAAVEPLWPLHSTGQHSALTALAQELQRLPPQVAPARDALARVTDRLGTLDAQRLSPAIGRQVERLSTALPLLRSGLDLIDLAPGLLGFDRPKTYIVLMQNDDELRPTGGFISAVARITLDRGEMVDLDVRDSYQVDDYAHKPYGWTPAPLLEFMGSQMWLFRDANWSPDFPTSARKAAELYAYGLGVPVDGVIGLNQRSVRDIVGGLGPLVVEPDQPPVDASNLIDYMRASWSPGPDEVDFYTWYTRRKDFVGKLMSAAVARVQTAADQVDWPKLGQAVWNSLSNRDLLIWLDEPAASAVLRDRGWDGAVRQVAGDYWMLVDANVGFNKVNAVVQSSIAYTVTLQPDGSADAEMTVQYRNSAPVAEGCRHLPTYDPATISYESLFQACYWNYVRLLVPPDAQLRQADSHPVPGKYLITRQPFDGSTRVQAESGKTVFATLFVLERGQVIDVKLAYHLPSTVMWTKQGGQYLLNIQKQPGAPLRRVSVALVWPDGYTLSEASLPSTHTDSRSVSFAFDLSTDQTLSVTWRQTS